jgi:hypothetical protein
MLDLLSLDRDVDVIVRLRINPVQRLILLRPIN